MAAPSEQNENVPHVQVKFATKQTQYSVPDSPFSVPSNVGVKELSSLINSLLEIDRNVDFDFLIAGEFLRVSLTQHLQLKEISYERVVEIEYILRHPPPKPEDSLVHDDWVTCVEGNGKYILSGSYDNSVKIWTTDGECILTMPSHSAPVKAITWLQLDDSPIAKFISTSHDQTVLIWSWNREDNSVECLNCCRGHAGSVECVAVDSTKTRFGSGSWDGMLKIWSTETTSNEDEDEGPSQKKRKDKVPTKVPLLSLPGHKECLSSIQWTDTNEICSAGWDHYIRLWDIENGTEKSSITGNKVFLDISYSELTRTIIAASSDRHIRLYDPRMTDGSLVQGTFTSHTGWVSGVAWSKTDSNLFISGSYDMQAKLWDTRSPTAPLYNLSGHEDKILAVDWSIPEYMLSGGADNHLKLFSYDTKSEHV